MRAILLLIAGFFIMSITLLGQSLKQPITYYLPDIAYDKGITTPEEFLGHQIGEWHITHDQSVAYMKLLASQSDRVEIEITGRTHENRPLLVLHISHPDNLKNKATIQAEHQKLADINQSKTLDLAGMPLVLYQGFSIHGNEPSGGNAAPLVAYYLAAGQSEEVHQLLKDCYILLDPCYNPDGFTRFSTWANSHKGHTLISDNRSREYNEVWPGGRTNHYWFDLNRDWLLLTHPESQSRITTFHKWLPNILTDHHEMGTNSTFFFQPGVPSRTNPNTPWINQELTEEIGTYHASALDVIGSQYYSKSGFDDFYYGKGSTYPDIHGSIGILFEQASSRGHYQESQNGIVTFPFTIRNQVTTALSTQRAGYNMREKLLDYQREFYRIKNQTAQADPVQAYIFSDIDETKLLRFAHILDQHQIEVNTLASSTTINGDRYEASNSMVVVSNQKQYGLIKTIFEKVTTFKDSIFYDVSAWTLPLAFDLNYAEVSASDLRSLKLNDWTMSKPEGKYVEAKKPYSWIFDWYQYHSAKAVYALLHKSYNVRVAEEIMTFGTAEGQRAFQKGAIIVPLQGSGANAEEMRKVFMQLSKEYNLDIYELESGYSADGLSTGNPTVTSLRKPSIFTLVGDGVSSYDVGELWHYMDLQLEIPITLIDISDLGRADLSRYTHGILANGSYNTLDERDVNKIRDWNKGGGVLIGIEGAVSWLSKEKFVTLERRKEGDDKIHPMRQYGDIPNARGSQVLGGAIFNLEVDLSHPLFFGYQDNQLPIFRQGTQFYEPTKPGVASPAVYGGRTVLHSGYVPRGLTNKAEGAVAVSVHNNGGKVICLQDNPLFRGYWWGSHRMFNNAIFFHQLIEGFGMSKTDD